MNGSKQYISKSNINQNDNKLQLHNLSTIDETHEENYKQSSLISHPPSPSSSRDDADDECSPSEGNTDRVADSKEEDEKDNSAEMSKVLDDMNSYKFCDTNILDNLDKINFASSMDRFVFQNLPLTNSQKEQLLLSMFSKV